MSNVITLMTFYGTVEYYHITQTMGVYFLPVESEGVGVYYFTTEIYMSLCLTDTLSMSRKQSNM